LAPHTLVLVSDTFTRQNVSSGTRPKLPR